MDADNDYDVMFRGRKVGRIWLFDYTGKLSGERARYLWHWYIRDVEGRKDTEGDAPTSKPRWPVSAARGMLQARTCATSPSGRTDAD
jgi:hypothetical protein